MQKPEHGVNGAASIPGRGNTFSPSGQALGTIRRALLSGHTVEFACGGQTYLLQRENNKGWDYLSVWRTSGAAQCLGRALFDILDGVSEETVQELLRLPCIGGRSVTELLPELSAVEIY